MQSAIRMGFSGDREDISQEVLLRMLEGKNRHSTIDQIVIDALRERAGRKGAPSYERRKNLYNSHGQEPGQLETLIGSYDGTNSDDRIDINRIAGFLNGDDRAILLLSCQWGMNEIEIGNLFGVSESRISQRLARISERLSARVKKEARSQGTGTSQVEEMGEIKAQGLECQANQSMAGEESRKMESTNEPCFQKWLT